jgi:uncharacterized protein DUF1990
LFCLKEPSEEDLRGFISRQQHSVFSYSEVGASETDVPSGYNVDRNRVFLGTGEGTWHQAIEAIREWQMFNIPWVRLYSPTTPIEAGATVAVLVRHFGFYSLNAARIVYVVDEDGPIVATALPMARWRNMRRAAKNDSPSSGIGSKITSGTSSSHFRGHTRRWLGWAIPCPGCFREDSRKHQRQRWLPQRAASEGVLVCD